LAIQGATNLEGHSPAYQWTVNGTPQTNATGATYSYPVPNTSGDYRVRAVVTDNAGTSSDRRTALSVTRDMAQVTVLPYSAPTITGTAANPQLQMGQQTALTLTPSGGMCNRNMTYTCTAPEGTVTGTPPAAFDSTGVRFDADRSRVQTKTVNVVCTVRDAGNGTSTTTIPITVSLPALQATRLEDIIFARNNARVNNCGKRIVLEELYPQLTEHPDWDLVLVGHTAPGETAGLDRRRALQVIAALTAGTDTCKNIEPSRINFSVVGSSNNNDTKPGFCGTSTERAGQAINQADANAAFRRVEVYLVPPGAATPAGGTRITAPLNDLKALGCPK
jgi:outer membrane protein OmpA-like peptidoglycan-associated protein